MRDGRNEIGRRAFISSSAGGLLGATALEWLLARESRGGQPNAANTANTADTAASTISTNAAPSGNDYKRGRRITAERVIVLFQNGGPSQMDLFDPKPELTRLSGKPYPGKSKVETLSPSASGALLGSPFKYAPAGQCGMQLSEIIPHTARIADDITLVRSMSTESVCHETALRIAHSGHPIATDKPSLGSWMLYGLGSTNDNLPAFVVLPDPGGLPINGTLNWSAGWLPASYQGTPFNAGDLSAAPVLNLKTPARMSVEARRRQLRLIDDLNRVHARSYPENSELIGRIENFSTAARMQASVPDVVDLSRETEATKRTYGIDQGPTAAYGTRCLLARRLVEQGVRFVGVYLRGQPWDTHADNANATKNTAATIDRPSAALVEDLKQRGLLESTLVVWMGEFGRTPVSQGANGRDHSRRGFSLWLAGGGFKRGHVHGNTDEFGYESVEDVVTMHDLHATILHAIGLDHDRLRFEHEGRAESLTEPELTKARVVASLLE